MSKRVLILVEGQTEERFVKDVLAPMLWDKAVYIVPTILVTKRVKDGANFKGGVTTFAKFENDARRLLNSAAGAMVTTLLDYYQLPSDFPGMLSRPTNGTPLTRVRHVEQAVAQHFGSRADFLPFFALHEFETWLFSDLAVLPAVFNQPSAISKLAYIRSTVSTPEEINERPEQAPSKQLERLFPTYRKTLHGPLASKRIGIEKIRSECPHFATWISALESFAAS